MLVTLANDCGVVNRAIVDEREPVRPEVRFVDSGSAAVARARKTWEDVLLSSMSWAIRIDAARGQAIATPAVTSPTKKGGNALLAETARREKPLSVLDAIIPGRYLYRRGLHTEQTLKRIGVGHLVWNLLTKLWLAWFPFWMVVTGICGSMSHLNMLTAGLFSPLGGLVMFAAPCLVVFYPGVYYLYYKQGVSLRHVSDRIFTTSLDGAAIRSSKLWLAWWRALLMPGIDVGNLKSKWLGRLTGATQIATFLVVVWLVSGDSLARLLSGGRASSLWFFDALATVVAPSGNLVGPLVCWVVSFTLLCVNISCGRKWVDHVAAMPLEERVALIS